MSIDELNTAVNEPDAGGDVPSATSDGRSAGVPGAGELLRDYVLELVGRAVGVLERCALAELDVEVDVTARAGAPGAQLVVADHASRAEGLDSGSDRVDLVRRQAVVDEDLRGARQ